MQCSRLSESACVLQSVCVWRSLYSCRSEHHCARVSKQQQRAQGGSANPMKLLMMRQQASAPKRASARSAADRSHASIACIAAEAGARSAWGRASPTTSATRARARSAGDHRCEHDRRRSEECLGSTISPHKSECKDSGRASICDKVCP